MQASPTTCFLADWWPPGAQQSQPGSGLSGGAGGNLDHHPRSSEDRNTSGAGGPPPPKACAHRCRGNHHSHGWQGWHSARVWRALLLAAPVLRTSTGQWTTGQRGPVVWCKHCSGSSAVPQWFLKTTKMWQQDETTRLTESTAADPAVPRACCFASQRASQHTPTRGVI